MAAGGQEAISAISALSAILVIRVVSATAVPGAVGGGHLAAERAAGAGWLP